MTTTMEAEAHPGAASPEPKRANGSEKPPRRLLIVEDEAIVAMDLELTLERLGYQVAGTCASGEEALAQVEQERCDLVLMDIVLDGAMDGIQTAAELGRRFDVPVVYLTSHSDEETLKRACGTAPHAYLLKPFQRRELLAAIEMTLHRHAMEREVRRQAERLEHLVRGLAHATALNEAIVSSLPVGILTLDGNSRILSVNPALSRLLQVPEHRLLGHELGTFIGDEGLANGIASCLRGQIAAAKIPVQLPRPDGLRHLEVTIVPLECEEPETPRTGPQQPSVRPILGAYNGSLPLMAPPPARVLLTIEDVTERHVLERAKREFISLVSHELRTPLTSIHGAVGLAASGALGELPERVQKMMEIAARNTDRLVRLINDILDLERLEAGRVTLVLAPYEVGSLLQQAAESLSPLAEQAGIQLVVESEPAWAYADADRVGQVLTNLIGNAIKFSTRGGRVWLSAAEHEGELQLSVRDEGRGIPEEKLGMLFQRFEQVDQGDARGKGGAGLGLAISRSLVELHGGRMWVDSVLGQGSTFTFSLPAAPPRELGAQATVPEESVTLLICDDDPTTRMAMRALLEHRGYRVLTASSGAEAVMLAGREQPTIILLDMMMPEMDGWQTLAALRSRPVTRHIPVAILSALEPQLAHPHAEEVVGWLTKPAAQRAVDAPGAFERQLRDLVQHVTRSTKENTHA
ncbi:MAG: response regulator [Deltaproteobacteria bacterium]|nr:response regulator [Deltaproteobacteria bacterium]